MRRMGLFGLLALMGCPHSGSNPLIGVPMLSAGGFHSVYKKADGSIYAWGDNRYGQIGDGTTENRPRPLRVGMDSDWAAASGGRGHTIAQKSDGAIWGWGSNQFGELRAYPLTNRSAPALIGTDADVVQVAAVESATIELKKNGALFAWGAGDELGAGDLHDPTPFAVQVGGPTSSSWAALPTGLSALQKDGSLWGWGFDLPNPVRLGIANDWQVAAGSFAIKKDGTLWVWGSACDVKTVECQNPVQVGTDTDWAKLGGALALKKDGTLWTYLWSSARVSFSQVGTDNDWDQIASGGCHFLAKKKEGSIWAWGCNDRGQLGLGDTQKREVPTKVEF